MGLSCQQMPTNSCANLNIGKEKIGGFYLMVVFEGMYNYSLFGIPTL